MPVNNTLHWEKISGAKLTQCPLSGGKRINYQDVFVTEVGEQYTIDNESRITISAFALNKVEDNPCTHSATLPIGVFYKDQRHRDFYRADQHHRRRDRRGGRRVSRTRAP
ncbi:MAG: hypothetical protein ACR5LG_13005 [Sodalis sp. (in: enterobacteria)]|uniref:hypothetical protein n=1 Tax=Sodalis sp. (in: enterobacteria) TaxID=1898979 RepID=UPI003F3F31E5